MSLIANIAGFAVCGLFARCFQLGLQKQPIFIRPLGHIYASVAFGGIGYAVYHLEQRQNELLAGRRKELKAIREREDAQYAAQKAAAAA